MKILFFIGSMGSGGAERVISILANHYARKNWQVEIALLLQNKVEYELDERIRIVDLTQKSASYFKNLPHWILAIRKHVKASKPDRIVSFVGRINALVLMSAKTAAPIIVSERNDPKHDGRGRLMLWLCNRGYKRKAASIVFQTEYEASCFSPSLKGKSGIIPNPVAIKATPTEAQGSTIVTAGRLTEQKNHTMLIDAVSLLQKNFPDLKASIYGDGHLKPSLQRQIDEKELGNAVTLCGNASDLHERIKTARLFVLTSEFEGLSNALIEAMMLGLPCITTDFPGVEEVIQHGENGYIVPRGDAQALANAIALILRDDTLRQKLIDGALRSSKNYCAETVIQKWEEIIERQYNGERSV